MKVHISLALLSIATLSFAPQMHSQSSQGARQDVFMANLPYVRFAVRRNMTSSF